MKSCLLMICCGMVSMLACKPKVNSPEDTERYQKIQGETMGTYYTITCKGNNEQFSKDIDNILIQLNKELSTYDPVSLISSYNLSATGISFNGKDKEFHSFLHTIAASKRIHDLTDGAFNPSLMPVINYWGFGYTGRQVVNEADSSTIDSLMKFVGMHHITIDSQLYRIDKHYPGIQMDFSAIAKGYGVDLVSQYLEGEGITDYLVDIGGESKSSGLNPNQSVWTLGINTPDPNASLHEAIVLIKLNHAALATSGNYRNYLKRADGTMYGHTIDAMTGYPVKTDILSASVIANDCMTADAFATSFMALGLSRSREKLNQLSGIEALFIYANETGGMETWHSDGFDQYLVK